MKITNKLISEAKKYWKECKAKSDYDYCAAVFRERLVKSGIPADNPAPGEEEYVRYWQQFHNKVEPYTYRYFQRICGNNPHIVPEDIAHRYIETVLNPVRFRAFYSDKNMYDRYLHPSSILPAIYMYRINGGAIYFKLSNRVVSTLESAEDVASMLGESVSKAVLKPSIDSNSGRKVMLFERNGRVLKNKEEFLLSGSFLEQFGSDWVLQEAITQHPYLQQFSKTSVNTIRAMTYRSIEDDTCSVFSAVLRIGKNGSFVDNLFGGGGFLTIDLNNGELGQCVYNRFWQSFPEINDIDFMNGRYILPFWDKIVDFAKDIAYQIPHARLLAQDITVDSEGNPRLIEFNVNSFDWAMSMTSGQIPFGDRFDEVINYCLKFKDEL